MGQKLPKQIIQFDSCSDDYAWYAIFTKFNCEQKFAHDFSEAISRYEFYEDFDKLFLPWKEYDIEKTNAQGKTVKRHKIEKIMSLYVFIHCRMNEHVYDVIRNTPGFADIMNSGGSIIIIPDEKIESIKQSCM